jgi:hypothetical protein
MHKHQQRQYGRLDYAPKPKIHTLQLLYKSFDQLAIKQKSVYD